MEEINEKIILISSILLAFGLISCSNSSGGKSDPNLARKWESALKTNQGATMTDNGDGTLSATFKAAYNGNGIVVYINEDKSAVATGKTVNVTFEYETKEWSDESLKPKFKVALCTEATDYYGYPECTSDGLYYDATKSEGSMTVTQTVAKKPADMLAIQFNTYNWTGADTDSVEIKLKSVEIE